MTRLVRDEDGVLEDSRGFAQHARRTIPESASNGFISERSLVLLALDPMRMDTACKDFLFIMLPLGLDPASGHEATGLRREEMKPYIIGAIFVWFTCGIVGAVMLGQQKVEVSTIAAGPISLWNGFDKPLDS